MDDEQCNRLIIKLKKHTSSNVTAKFLETLKKLAVKNVGNFDGFSKSCRALGKFDDDEDFLKEFQTILLEQESIQKKEEKPNINLEGPGLRLGSIKKKLNSQHFFEDDNDDELFLRPNLSSKNQTVLSESNPKIVFKKLNKDRVEKMKEYNTVTTPVEVAATVTSNLTSTENLRKSTQFQTTSEKMENANSDSDAKLNISSDQSDYEYSDDGSETLEEDREWYNDEDLGNTAIIDNGLTMDDVNSEVSTYKNVTNTPSVTPMEIQLYPMSLQKLKEYFPKLLVKKSGPLKIDDKDVASFIFENRSRSLISPFKNPESKFSVIAKKGSAMVAQRRLQNDNSANYKKSTEVVGTALGEVIGMQDDKGANINHEDLLETDAEMTTLKDIKDSRKSLPAYKARYDFLRMVRENQVVIVIGQTGSGKTTQLGQYLHEDGYCDNGQLIGCTQPRRVAAMSVAKRVAQEMNVKVGNEVGYSIRFEDCTSPKTRIKFLTDGILLREAMLDPALDKYSCIIIDEAHERSLNTDVLLGFFKTILMKRRNLKLIITSATLNAKKFSEFFGNAPYFTIPGRTYPVQVVNSETSVDDYVQAAVTEAVRIHVTTKIDSGDILIFMTGQEDIETTAFFIKQKILEIYAKRLNATISEELTDAEIFPIYSALPADIQNKVFINFNGTKRKIVIATNIAETSLTIDAIRYVIDCGYSKMKMFSPKIGLDVLAVVPISIANADQRSGRAGRTAPGTTFRLYSKTTMEEDMYRQTIPEIQRTNLSNTVLLLKSLGTEDVTTFPLLDPPPAETLLASLYELWFLGALDNTGKLSALGKIMAKFPLQPSLSKILVISASANCSEEILTIVSMLSVPQIFNRTKQNQKDSDRARTRFFVSESDHLTLLNVYSQWKSNSYSSSWSKRHFLNQRSLQRANEVRKQLVKLMNKQKLSLCSSGKDWDIIKKCICSGYSHQAGKLVGLNKYIHLRTGIDMKIHPTSALHGLGDLPQYVVYHELLVTKQEYMCCITSVDPFWLMEFGGILYEMKRVKISNKKDLQIYENILDVHDEHEEQEDELDYKIEKCLNHRNNLLEQIQNASIATPNDDLQGSTNDKRRIKSSSANAGFKKRRPM